MQQVPGCMQGTMPLPAACPLPCSQQEAWLLWCKSQNGQPAHLQEFRDDPDTFCTRLPPITVPEALIRLHYSVQDVPG